MFENKKGSDWVFENRQQAGVMMKNKKSVCATQHGIDQKPIAKV